MSGDTFQSGVYLKGTYHFEDLLDLIRQGEYLPECGAIACFIGIARNIISAEINHAGLEKLLIESNSDLANPVIQEICSELTKGEVKKVLICHLEGEFAVGEDLVYVIVAGGHRQAVFAALQEVCRTLQSKCRDMEERNIY